MLPTLTFLLLCAFFNTFKPWLPNVEARNAKILIFSATLEYRHVVIPTAIEVLKQKGPMIGVEFDATESPSLFTDENLSKYDGLLFLSTTGNVLTSKQLQSFQNYLNTGGNFIGIHSASDSCRNSPTYAKELGSLFASHPELQSFEVDVLEPSHPSVRMLPSSWIIEDEAYNFVSDPRSLGAKVVLAADESTYVDNNKSIAQGTPHPIAWYQEKGAGVQPGGTPGRSFYTSLGHLPETWQNEIFQEHILGSISWLMQSNTTRAFNASAVVGNGASNSTTAAIPDSTQGNIENPVIIKSGYPTTSDEYNIFPNERARMVLREPILRT